MLTTLTVVVVAVAVASRVGLLGLEVVTSGSMVPALQVGDLLVTHRVPADEARVGDVVTVLRPDGQQVTHRVLATRADPEGDGGSRLITLRGDDNSTTDPVPYAVDTVAMTLVRLPVVGGVLHRLTQPPTREIAIATLAVLAVLVLWPTGSRGERQ
ncbi:MAG TPA: signal peptidase I [Cellulomonas sp.]